MGKTKLDVARRISEELGRKVVFDGTLPVDKTGVVDPETGTIRLNSRVGGPENLFDNASKLIEEQEAGLSLDSVDLEGYNANEKNSSNSSKILWDSWQNYPKIYENGQYYAKVGNRLYSKHAVNRMQPSGNRFGPYIWQTENEYGRSVAPQFVEDVINSSRPILQDNGNLAYVMEGIKVITNSDGAVVTIITFS